MFKEILNQTILATLILAPGSCATIGANARRAPVLGACAAFAPIYTHDGDVFTQRTSDEILLHNLTGQEICGWKKKHELKLNK